jgi:hypothetical protein
MCKCKGKEGHEESLNNNEQDNLQKMRRQRAVSEPCVSVSAAGRRDRQWFLLRINAIRTLSQGRTN